MPIKNAAQKIRSLKVELAKLRRENKRLKKALAEYESDDEDYDDDDEGDSDEDDF